MDELVEQITERLINWIGEKKDAPFTLDLRPTERCNLKCLSCAISKKKKEDILDELSYEKYLQVIKEAEDIGIKRVEIVGGGEPLILGKRMLNIMLEIKKRGMFGSITTNATLFNEEMVKKLVRSEWNLIAVSLDGPDPETHDHLRGVEGTFERVIKSIKLFQKWKKRLNKTLPEIIFIPVLSNQNYTKIKGLITLAEILGVKKVEFKTLVMFDDTEIKKLQLNNDQLKRFKEIAKEAEAYADEQSIETNLHTFIEDNFAEKSKNIVKVMKKDVFEKNPKVGLSCFLPFFYIAINTNGAVEPCVVQQNKAYESVTKKSLRDIWCGNYFNSFRKKILKGEIPERCKGCCGGILFDNRKIRNRLLEKLDQKGNQK